MILFGSGWRLKRPLAADWIEIRIVNLVARSEREQAGEIPRAHRRGRHRFDHPWRGVKAPDALVAVHEECPVVAVIQLGQDHRAAHIGAPAIQPELRFAGREAEVFVGREHRVLHEVVDLAVRSVAAGFQAHVDRSAAHESGTGIEGGRLDLELFHHARGRRVSDLRALHIRRAIHHELIASRPRTVDRHSGRRTGIERANVAGRFRSEDHAGRQSRHRDHHAVFQGQLVNRPALDDLAHRRGGCIQQRRLGFDFHRLVGLADFQGDVDRHLVVDPDDDAASRVGLEAGMLHFHRIGPGNQHRKDVISGSIG